MNRPVTISSGLKVRLCSLVTALVTVTAIASCGTPKRSSALSKRRATSSSSTVLTSTTISTSTTSSTTTPGEQPGTTGFLLFAKELNAHVVSGDFQFIYNRILPTHFVCTAEFVNGPDLKHLVPCSYIGQQLDLVSYADLEGRWTEPSGIPAVISNWIGSPDPNLSDSYGSGALRVYGIIPEQPPPPSTPTPGSNPYASLEPQPGPAALITWIESCSQVCGPNGHMYSRWQIHTDWIYVTGEWRVDFFGLANEWAGAPLDLSQATPL